MDGISCTWPNQTIEYPRIIFYEEDTFSFEISLTQIEPGKLLYFAHVYIWDFKPSVLKTIRTRWAEHRPRMPRILYASGNETDKKWTKWVRMFGFHPLISDAECSDGERRDIYVHFRE
jgi:hypothetical protein